MNLQPQTFLLSHNTFHENAIPHGLPVEGISFIPDHYIINAP